jgi:hypothetical protein
VSGEKAEMEKKRKLAEAQARKRKMVADLAGKKAEAELRTNLM